MLEYSLKILRLDRVEEVEEVLARRPFTSRVAVREVLGELGVALYVRPQCLHRELIVVRDCDMLDICLLHQLLFARKNVLQEVLVDAVSLREVVLNWKYIEV